MAHKPGHFGPTEWADIDMSGYTQNNAPMTVPTSTNFATLNPDSSQYSGYGSPRTNLLTQSYGNAYGGASDTPFGKMGDAFGKLGITSGGMDAFGSAITGLGSLASGWAALKNIGIQKDALANQNQQWQTNYESQRTATNNQISNQNAFKKAQGRSDYGSYVGGKPTGTNYV